MGNREECGGGAWKCQWMQAYSKEDKSTGKGCDDSNQPTKKKTKKRMNKTAVATHDNKCVVFVCRPHDEMEILTQESKSPSLIYIYIYICTNEFVCDANIITF